MTIYRLDVLLSQFGTILAVTYFQSKNESGILSEVDSESSLKKKSNQTLEIWNHLERWNSDPLQ